MDHHAVARAACILRVKDKFTPPHWKYAKCRIRLSFPAPDSHTQIRAQNNQKKKKKIVINKLRCVHWRGAVVVISKFSFEIFQYCGFLFLFSSCVYCPQSGTLDIGHRDAVAVKPWRRFRTRDLCSSPLQHGTIVPPFNGALCLSLFPISVPVMKKKKEKLFSSTSIFNL